MTAAMIAEREFNRGGLKLVYSSIFLEGPSSCLDPPPPTLRLRVTWSSIGDHHGLVTGAEWAESGRGQGGRQGQAEADKDQRWANRGPGTAYGPLIYLTRPAEPSQSFHYLIFLSDLFFSSSTELELFLECFFRYRALRLQQEVASL